MVHTGAVGNHEEVLQVLMKERLNSGRGSLLQLPFPATVGAVSKKACRYLALSYAKHTIALYLPDHEASIHESKENMRYIKHAFNNMQFPNFIR